MENYESGIQRPKQHPDKIISSTGSGSKALNSGLSLSPQLNALLSMYPDISLGSASVILDLVNKKQTNSIEMILARLSTLPEFCSFLSVIRIKHSV